MGEDLLQLVTSAIGMSWVVAGIVQKIKENYPIEGLQVILVAIITGTVLLGCVALIFGHPLAESLLMGIITGFASIGAFEGYEKTKEQIQK